MKLKKLIPVTIFCVLISACSSNIADYITHSKSFPYDEIVSSEQIETWGFKKGSYRDTYRDLSISYLYAAPLEKGKIKYSIETDSGQNTTTVALAIDRKALKNSYSGTLILLHGFRASKEFMLNSALYFRLLGFHVVIPDLLGHGESGGNKEYGVGDSKIINRLIDDLIDTGIIENQHIYLLGNSMGSLAAARISQSRQDISGLILQAPMLEFDQAVYLYAKENFPLLSKAISEDEIKIGALTALKEANIRSQDTKIEPLIMNSSIPVLLFTSNTDPISPYDHFKNLDQGHIRVVNLPKRNHPSMAIIGDIEHRILQEWLTPD
ncbi:alpha/beta hydrolase [Microbulbifer sp. THAF38]|uniref:alpha/beta hydrolase n=1 Tax=Microbulbifer sp. THAF38 TaxID=2587856 RepID=UPI0012685F33|nr:alpha/beta fold hydrolase [Microbulbifer sp. THAF38]QFT56576.1 Alpha/beta hydrolase family protein [Microbulbifer sp. THAF38]